MRQYDFRLIFQAASSRTRQQYLHFTQVSLKGEGNKKINIRKKVFRREQLHNRGALHDKSCLPAQCAAFIFLSRSSISWNCNHSLLTSESFCVGQSEIEGECDNIVIRSLMQSSPVALSSSVSQWIDRDLLITLPRAKRAQLRRLSQENSLYLATIPGRETAPTLNWTPGAAAPTNKLRRVGMSGTGIASSAILAETMRSFFARRASSKTASALASLQRTWRENGGRNHS